jgi:hypothetical protein
MYLNYFDSYSSFKIPAANSDLDPGINIRLPECRATPGEWMSIPRKRKNHELEQSRAVYLSLSLLLGA